MSLLDSFDLGGKTALVNGGNTSLEEAFLRAGPGPVQPTDQSFQAKVSTKGLLKKMPVGSQSNLNLGRPMTWVKPKLAEKPETLALATDGRSDG
jgi:hypothetical protein